MALDFKHIGDNELDTFLSRKAFNLTDDQISEVSFIFWLVYYAERKIKEQILNPLIQNITSNEYKGRVEDVAEIVGWLLDDSTFLTKINTLEKIMSASIYKDSLRDYFSYCKQLNQMRNLISHNKIDLLVYKESPVRERKVKEQMLIELPQIPL
jgi:hypothetical protein